MAIITKIRQYSGIAIFFIAFSIAAFVLADLLGGATGIFGGAQKRYVGEINGTNIDFNDYNAQVEQQTNMLRAQGREVNDQISQSIREQVWSQLIFDYAYTEQFDQLGIQVTDEELAQMVQGDSMFIHPQIRQQFTNPETQEFDKQQVINYLKQLSGMPPLQRIQWQNFEDGLRRDRLRSKYEDLFKLSSYVTKAEAERDYTNKQTKAEIKYLYIPFSSIVDSTVQSKVTDAMLQEELNKYPDKYKARETRSLDYITFEIKPSAQDSAEFLNDMRLLSQDFAKANNDSSFAATNSDLNETFDFKTLDQIPGALFDENPTILKGGVYGPYLDQGNYKIYKVAEMKEDTVEFVRSRHILFKVEETAPDEDKAEVLKQANEVLQELKDGADFAQLAKQYSEDPGSGSRGGDLGWYSKGKMVPEFESASFTDTPGLVPNLVKSKYGYHIIDVTNPKTKNTYKLATISRKLEPGQETRDSVLYIAQEVMAQADNGDELRAFIEQDSSLTLLTASKINTTDSRLGVLNGAREVIKWAFGDDVYVGDRSEVMDLQDQNTYLIATLTEKVAKDESNVEIFRDELTSEVIKKIKAEQIIAKLDKKAKSLDDIKNNYGDQAQVNTANDVTLDNNTLGTTGINPAAVGKVFSLKKGKRSEFIQDDTGVFLIELVKITPAPKIADHNQNKTDLESRLGQSLQFLIRQAIEKAADIEDRRYKFY